MLPSPIQVVKDRPRAKDLKCDAEEETWLKAWILYCCTSYLQLSYRGLYNRLQGRQHSCTRSVELLQIGYMDVSTANCSVDSYRTKTPGNYEKGNEVLWSAEYWTSLIKELSVTFKIYITEHVNAITMKAMIFITRIITVNIILQMLHVKL